MAITGHNVQERVVVDAMSMEPEKKRVSRLKLRGLIDQLERY